MPRKYTKRGTSAAAKAKAAKLARTSKRKKVNIDEARFSYLKQVFVAGLNTGKKRSEIQKFLELGNATARYIDESETYQEYRDRVTAQNQASVLYQQRVAAAKSAMSDEQIATAEGEGEPNESPTPTTSPELPHTGITEYQLNVKIAELKKWMANEFAPAVVSAVHDQLEATAVLNEEVRELETAQPSDRRFFGRKG
jgi:hypothetical protein